MPIRFEAKSQEAGEGQQASSPLVASETLDKAETSALLSRLESLEVAAKEDFRIRDASKPRPRRGATISAVFPASEERVVTVQATTLEVLSIYPEGEVPVAAKVSVSFNQAVVKLGQSEDLPLRILSAGKELSGVGNWRAIGTKTLMFEPADRMPGATEFEVVIPAETQSVLGVKLGSELRSTFQTPALRLLVGAPTRQLPPSQTPVILLVFDQQVDPEKLLPFIEVKGGIKNTQVEFVSQDLEELRELDESFVALVHDRRPGTWLVVRPLGEMPAGRQVHVLVGVGAPSGEGPLLTSEEQKFQIEFAGEFRVRKVRCGYGDKPTPEDPWIVEFTTPINTETFDVLDLEIEPSFLDVPKADIYPYQVSIRGAKRGSQTYKLRLPDGLRDEHGQSLSGATEFKLKVGESAPRLISCAQELLTLREQGSRSLPVRVVNIPTLRISVWEVEPMQWREFLDFRNSSYERSGTCPGVKLGTRELATQANSDEVTMVEVDLEWALPKGELGHRVVVIEPDESLWHKVSRKYSSVYALRTWVQATALSGAVLSDRQKLKVWVNDLETGEPLADVKLTSSNSMVQTTDEAGIAEFGLTQEIAWLVARAPSGTMSLMTPNYGSWYGHADNPETLFHVLDDRGMYKPGETLHLKGWVRRRSGRTGNDLISIVTRIQARVTDALGHEICELTTESGEFGDFDLEIDLPETPALGDARVSINANGNTHDHWFKIQEFRRPEYEVTARLSSEGPCFVGEELAFCASANYFTGEGLAGLDADWSVSATQTTFRPAGWADFTFVKAPLPWFWWTSDEEPPAGEITVHGVTGPAGDHWISAQVLGMDSLAPVVLEAEAKVTDLNRQSWARKTSAIVHTASLYVGLKTKSFVSAGEALELDVILVGIDGVVHPELAVGLELQKVESTWKDGISVTRYNSVWAGNITSSDQAHRVSQTVEKGGRYRWVGRTADEYGRQTETLMEIFVAGSEYNKQTTEGQDLLLIPDSETYAVGDVAKVFVGTEMSAGYGLLTLRYGALIEHHAFQLDEFGNATVDVEIAEDLLPGFVAGFDVVGVSDDRPAFAYGTLDLSVSSTHRELVICVNAADEAISPGEGTRFEIQVKTPDGEAAPNTLVAFWVVDEAILALTAYETPDPITTFYRTKGDNTACKEMRSTLLSERSPETEAYGGAMDLMSAPRMRGGIGQPMMAPAMVMNLAVGEGAPGGAPPEAAGEPIQVRSNFDPLAAFHALMMTDENGVVAVDVKVTDNLTRYRAIVNASHPNGVWFGSADSQLVARLPLTIRPSPPRFANFGDRFEFPIIVHNARDTGCSMNIAIRAQNLEFEGAQASGKRVNLSAGERAEVRFPAQTQNAGEVTYQVVVDGDGFADAASGDFPVYTPATSEAFATYGVIDEGAIIQPLERPEDVIEDFGGVEVTTSSTALQALTDAVLYLATYAYDCAEQRASRMLAISALSDVLTAFDVEALPSPEALKASVHSDIDALGRSQHLDGGWGFWAKGKSWPLVTCHVVHALVVAKEKGFEVDIRILEQGLEYLDRIERYLLLLRYPKASRLHIRAYASFVRSRSGLNDEKRARQILKKAATLGSPGGFEGLDFCALGWLWSVLKTDKKHSDLMYQHVKNRITETESKAMFVERFAEEEGHLVLASNRRTDAVMLWSLMDFAAEGQVNLVDQLITKVVQGLMAHRVKGRWGSTQENSHVLLALDRYFRVYEAQEPDFVARVWLGETYAGEHSFSGRTTERHRVDVPMSEVLAEEQPALTLQKEGAGRMYYRLGMSYVPTSLDLGAKDCGFIVSRTYEAVDDEADVTRDDEGVWVVKAGARVKVTLRLVAPMQRHHVALVDPIPAGFEIINPALAVTEALPPSDVSNSPWAAGLAIDGDRGPWFFWARWWRPWFEHQNFRDERAEAFTTNLYPGVHRWEYYARATTPGEFIVPPARAEEMYEPEVYGRTSTERFVVKS